MVQWFQDGRAGDHGTKPGMQLLSRLRADVDPGHLVMTDAGSPHFTQFCGY